MLDALLALVTVLLVVVLLCAVGVAVTVLPFVLGVDAAERGDLSTGRAGTWCLTCIAVALGAALLARHHPPLAVLLLVLAWAGPGVVALLGPADTATGGRAGTHER